MMKREMKFHKNNKKKNNNQFKNNNNKKSNKKYLKLKNLSIMIQYKK